MDTPITMREEIREHLLHTIISFWKKLRDEEFGGSYWSLHYDGAPFDTAKHTYNQAFCINALTSYYEASKEQDVSGGHTKAYGDRPKR